MLYADLSPNKRLKILFGFVGPGIFAALVLSTMPLDKYKIKWCITDKKVRLVATLTCIESECCMLEMQCHCGQHSPTIDTLGHIRIINKN